MSSLVRIGPAFVWFRLGKKIVLKSRYTTDAEPPDSCLAALCWPTVGLFLGQTSKGTNVDIDPKFTEQNQSVDFINTPTDSYLENQYLEISMQLAYTGVKSITDLFRLPEKNQGGTSTNTRSINPYEGSLLIAASNIRNSDPTLHHLVDFEWYKRVKVVPSKVSIGEGHSPLSVKFVTLAPKEDNGCYSSSDYERWTISTYNPNTRLMPNGLPINTNLQIPYPINNHLFMDL